MWYFAWILGVTAALAFGVINVMWYEFQNEFESEEAATEAASAGSRKVHG
ncbi:cytochrome bd-I oxidase subunit CydX [Rhabdaerophilum sp. SD176]|nr:cytochrome bd-I oxidase subunit CydX [Rhabdaerophilum sp. SD176]